MDYLIIFRTEYWGLEEETTKDYSDLLETLKELIDKWNIIISVHRR